MQTYAEVLDFIEREVGCEIKSYDELCEWAHYSPGVAKGGEFTRFTCSCCGYSPSEKQWYADLKKWNDMTDEQQKVARAKHADAGEELLPTKQHYHQELYLFPLPRHGMDRCGVDNLHL
eukprot:7379321-Prymnesium_polylepis.1